MKCLGQMLVVLLWIQSSCSALNTTQVSVETNTTELSAVEKVTNNVLKLLENEYTMTTSTTINSSEAVNNTNKECMANEDPSVFIPNDDEYREIEGGVMNIVSYSCDFPPRIVPIAADYVYYFPVGSRIKLLCESNRNTTCVKRSHFLVLRNTTSVSTQVLDDYQTLFTVDFNQPTDIQWLICHCNTSETPTNVGPVRKVLVDYKPSKVEDFECIVKDYKDATCTWDNQENKDVVWESCIGLTRTPNTSYHDCGPRKESKLLVELVHWQSEYTATINGTNNYGSTVTEIYLSLDDGILSAPNVTLTRPVGSTEITLNWNQQCDTNPTYRLSCKLFGLNYSIVIAVNEKMTPDLENIFKAERSFEVNDKFKPRADYPSASTPQIITISSLMPYTYYKLTMTQIMGDSKRWSEPETIVFKTTEAIPHRGPYFHPNGFTVTSNCKNKGERLVKIYWKGLDIHSGANGDVTKYTYKNNTIEKEMRETAECSPAKNPRMFMYAYTRLGKGSKSSYIDIPSDDNLIKIPSCLLQVQRTEKKKAGNGVTLNWELISHHLSLRNISNVNYTLFWCKLDPDVNSCQGEFDWLEIGSSNKLNEHTLMQMKYNRTEYRYGIGVAYNKFKSGILWAGCLLGSALPKPDDVALKVNQRNLTHARVKIEPVCRDNMDMLNTIELRYCQQGDSSSCRSIPPFKGGHCEKEITVKLAPDVPYDFWVKKTYNRSPGVWTGQKFDGFKLTDKTDDTETVIIAAVTSIAAAVLISVFIGACLYCRRKRRTSRKMFGKVRAIPPTIIPPEPIPEDTDSDCSELQDNDDLIAPYLFKNPTADVPLISQQKEVDGPESPVIQTDGTNAGEINEKSRLVSQLSTESTHSARLQHAEETSDYGTDPDNSGASSIMIGYTKVPGNLMDKHRCALQTGYHPDEMINQDQSGPFLEDMSFSTVADNSNSDGTLFKGITLADVMKPSALHIVDDENTTKPPDEYMAVTDVLDKRPESVDSTPLNSGYVQVERIVDKNSNDTLADDYLKVHDTGVAIADKENTASNIKTKHSFPMGNSGGDLNSAGTTFSFNSDLDEYGSGNSAIDMAQFLDQTTV